MKLNKSSAIMIIIFVPTIAFLIYIFCFEIPKVNRENGTYFIKKGIPTINQLITRRTPRSNHEPMPTGANPEKWDTEYNWRFNGEINKFDVEEYKKQHKTDVVIKHKEGEYYTIYTIEIDEYWLPIYKIGRPL